MAQCEILHLGAAQVERAVLEASASSTPAASSSANGGVSASLRMLSSATASSTSPVIRFGLTFCGSRLVTDPATLITSSERSRCGGLVCLWRDIRMEHELHESLAVTQVNEDQPAVVTPAVHPAGHARLGPCAVSRELPAPGIPVVVWSGGVLHDSLLPRRIVGITF